MSFEINPSSLSGTAFARELEDISSDVDMLDYFDIASIIELAVKHGLVSPPVYVIRDAVSQELMEDPVSDRPHVYSLFNHHDPSEHEHWKGQAE